MTKHSKDAPGVIRAVLESKEPGVVVCRTKDGNEYVVKASANAGMLPRVGVNIHGFVREEML